MADHKLSILGVDLSSLEAHPLANIFPMIDDREFPAFKDDIAQHGLTDEVILLDGKILDGRNRYKALKALGWETQPHYYLEFNAMAAAKGLNQTPFDFVISKNEARRHLNEGQRAMAAARAATMRQGERNDIKPLPIDPEPSANVRKVSQGEAAEMFKVSERLVSSANRVIETGIEELRNLVDRAKVAVSVAEEIARMPAETQAEVLATYKPDQLKNVAKKQERDRRAKSLAEKQQALPIKKYGLIYADPEWEYVTRSENGMDRAAANHYPTSPLDVIQARRVADIAADDCVLALWATVPMLIEAICVAEAWGFMLLVRDDVTGHLRIDRRKSRYVSNWDWIKNTIGNGYWGRNQHEHLLLFTKGNPVAPAPGTQPPSAMHSAPRIYPDRGPGDTSPLLTDPAGAGAAVREHSRKPDIFREWLEKLFPDTPKIELNAREARPGWDRWGNEAPEAEEPAPFDQMTSSVPDINGKPVKAGDDVMIDDHVFPVRRVYKNGNISIDNETGHMEVAKAGTFSAVDREADESADQEPAPAAKPAIKKPTAWEKADKEFQQKRTADANKLRSIGRDLPDDHAGLVSAYVEAINAMDAAAFEGDANAVIDARDRMRSIVLKCNNWEWCGSAVNDQANAIIAAASARPPEQVFPKFGQLGAFKVTAGDIDAIVKVSRYSDDGGTAELDIYAITPGKPFTSSTGLHSCGAIKIVGKTMEAAGIEAVNYSIRYATDKKLNPYAGGLKIPATVHAIDPDGVTVHRIEATEPEEPAEASPEVPPASDAKPTKGTKKGKTDAK